MTPILLLFIICLEYYSFVSTYKHQKPLHKTLWNEKCKKHDVVLNDCNWCWCDDRHRYTCKARVCQEIDMFGHFKDAIQDINVGMEGHGVWRSTPMSCSPGVHYQREAMLCVCNEDGNWPSPVCRDVLRVLRVVELTNLQHPDSNFTCSPTKLYLVGCNVCFCPSQGSLNPNLCTQNICVQDDPVFDNATKIIRSDDKMDAENLEIYASCKPNEIYKIGCMSCKCLRNNRLDCKPCIKQKNHTVLSSSDSVSIDKNCRERKAGEVFEDDCNLCYCDEKYRKVCTIRKCIKKKFVSIADIAKYTKSKIKLISTTAPVDYEDCTPGTMFYEDCNTCKCVKLNTGKKIIQCTVNLCNTTNNLDVIKKDCVLKTTYEWKCMICYCEKFDGDKIQTCFANAACQKPQNSALNDLNSLHGYCEPLHTYNYDCNKCRCLIDGETLICTTKKCMQRSSDPVTVEVIPVTRSHNLCPKGLSFNIKCNTCFCLLSGNAICTTTDCYKNKFKIEPIIN